MLDRNMRARAIYIAERLERHTKLPGHHAGTLGQTGLAILRCLLFRFARYSEPSYKEIRAATGFAFSTISEGLKRLERAGLLFIERRKIRTPQGNRVINNRYTVAQPAREGLIPADVEQRKPESFLPWNEWVSPLKDALESLSARLRLAG